MSSRYISIRADNQPASGKVSFKNGFPVLSFTISAQDGMLDPRTVRIAGNFSAYKDNLATPTPLSDGDNVTMNNRLGIYNIIESLTIRANRSKMVCESIRHYSKFMNSYLAMTSSLENQLSFLGSSCLINPNSTSFRKSVMESPEAEATQTNSFAFHVPSGFMSSGNMINLREDAFGGIVLEFLLQPDSNVLYNEAGSTTGIGDAHYELSDLELTCEVHDIPADAKLGNESEGAYTFNGITSLYTSINSTNAQIQYNLALRNVLSAFMTMVPVADINTLTEDGQVTVYPSGDGTSNTALAPFTRIQFLKGGSKFPNDFDVVTNIVDTDNTGSLLPDPQIIGNFIDAVHPQYTDLRMSASPVNTNRDYTMAISSTVDTAYNLIAEGGGVTGLAVSYGLGGAGADFSTEPFGVSIESELKSDRPMGVYLFIKAKTTLVYDNGSIQIKDN